jgi:arsenite methyltransferase
VGPTGSVTFSDISEPLLDRCHEITGSLGLGDRSRFVKTGLPDLSGIPDGSVDVAMTRSVLIYVDDKRTSFTALRRVLRPGGRLSIFEPINRFGEIEPANLLWGYEVTGLESIADRVKHAYRKHLPAGNPMENFDERDLLADAEAAGFTGVELDYQVRIEHTAATSSWEAMLRHAPNPLVPPLETILKAALSADDFAALATHMPKRMVMGRQRRIAVAYLRAVR